MSRFSEETVLQRWPVFHWESQASRVINYHFPLRLLTLCSYFQFYLFLFYFRSSISLGLISRLETTPYPSPLFPGRSFLLLIHLPPDVQVVDVVTDGRGLEVSRFLCADTVPGFVLAWHPRKPHRQSQTKVKSVKTKNSSAITCAASDVRHLASQSMNQFYFKPNLLFFKARLEIKVNETVSVRYLHLLLGWFFLKRGTLRP